MPARHRRKAYGIVLGLLMLSSSAGHAQTEEERFPILGLTLREKIGSLISIPGNPFPPLSADSMRRVISIQEAFLKGLRVFGEGPPLARGLGYVATLHASVGDVATAERRFDEAQKILEKDGATGLDLGWVHNNRGLARLDQGRYADAVGSFRAAVAALRPGLLESRATALRNLALANQLLGEIEDSEDAYLQALEISRGLGKERGRTFQMARENLALLYSSIGDFTEARKILKELLAQDRLDSSLRFAVLNNLGYILSVSGDAHGAVTPLREALALTPERSRGRALALTNLTAAYAIAGDFERARQEGERALRLAEELYGPGSPSAATVEATLGFVAMAREDLTLADSLLSRARKALSIESRDQQALAIVTHVLALVAQRRGQRERAGDLSRQALDLEKQNLDQILAFGSEAQRLAYRSNAAPYDQLSELGDATLLADAVLATKGAVLESLLAERALVRKSRSAEDRERLDRIHGLKVELMEKVGRDESGLDPLERSLKQEETALAKSLARVSPERPRADLSQVQAALGSDQILIEIIRFQLYEEGGKLAPWYGAVVIPHQGRPAWVPLGRAEGLEELTGSLVERLDVGVGVGTRGVERLSAAGDVARTLRELDDRLWKPLAKVFPVGTRKVLLSPDGALSFVPWAALLDENEKFLAESWELTQVSSGRDLLRAAAKSPAKTLLALADGTEDLPAARKEVEDLDRRAKQQGWRATILKGEEASETALFQHPHPRILHFATHGGQLHGDLLAKLVESRLSKQPMYRGFRSLEARHSSAVLRGRYSDR